MSQTYLSVFIMLAAQILPKLGISVGDAELTTTVQTITTIGGAIWILIRRYQSGGVDLVGRRV